MLQAKIQNEFCHRVSNPMPGILACDPMPRHPGLGFSKFQFALSKMGMEPAGGRSATDPSLSAALCTCTRVSCAPILARSLNPPFRHSIIVVFQTPPGRSHAHFAECELEFGVPRPGLKSLAWDHRPRSLAWDSKRGFETRTPS